jgi:hypothetical protein
MARLAGLSLEQLTDAWHVEPFTSVSQNIVSVWRIPVDASEKGYLLTQQLVQLIHRTNLNLEGSKAQCLLR